MAGKPYSIREMKTIVDYLVQNKAYAEIKGRKMWMDFAGTRLTSRTWQSLREVFLKRILPDITNPYYRLDIEQIHSFKRGVNLTEKDKKLDFKPVEDKTNNNDVNGDERPSTSNNEEDATGEDTTCSKVVHNRASTETLILENCYNTAEEIRRDLEVSTDSEQDNDENNDKQESHKPPVKSLRDFIVYTEPLTPMLQEVLHDFESEEESDRMLIDENYEPSRRQSNSPDNAVLSQSILKPQAADNPTANAKIVGNETKTPHDISNNNEQHENTVENQATGSHDLSVNLSQLEDVMNLVDKALSKHLVEIQTEKESQEKVQNSHETSSNITDTLLPNNQEAASKITDALLPSNQETSSNITDTLLPNNQEAVDSGTFPKKSPILSAPQVNDKQSSKIEGNSLSLSLRIKRKRSNTPEVVKKHKTKKQKDLDQSIANNKGDALENTEINDKLKQTDVEDLSEELNKEANHDKTNDPKTDFGKQKNKSETFKKKKHNLSISNAKTSNLDTKEKSNAIANHSAAVSPTVDIPEDNRDIIVYQSTQIENPCLKSVSLYAEQFSSAKYSDSDINIVEDDGNKAVINNDTEPKSVEVAPVSEKADDVILLKSRSNTESENSLPKNMSPRLTVKQKREKIAKVFGFANGGPQNKKTNGRRRTVSHRSYQYITSESSEWTSASDSEYVSPPRGRRYRYLKNRRYYKPHSGTITSLEDCGGMYVMLGKKIYPITKQGKNIQNYVRKTSESDPDEEENYWKNKYVEERKRTGELKKIISKSKQNGIQILDEPESPIDVSPIPLGQHQLKQSLSRENVNGDELVKRKDNVTPEKSREDKTLKIKFTKKDQEIQLEGHWQNINPVLAQVVSMFHSGSAKPEPPACVELSSGTTTPRPIADTGVKDKINKIESDIFNEIIEQNKEEQQPVPTEENKETDKTSVEKDSNITVRKRRGRPKKANSPAMTTRTSKSSEPSPRIATELNNIEEEKDQVVSDVPTKVVTEKRTTRTPRKLLEDATNATTEQAKSRKSTEEFDEDTEVFYKLPSPLPVKRGRKSKANLTNNAIETSSNHTPQITPLEGISNNSINSNQGYQDSDASPFNIGLRRKRRFSVSTMSLKGRKPYRKRSKSHPHLVDYETSESSNSPASKSVAQSSVNSEVHRSESYQLLMPRTRKIIQALGKIEESSHELNSVRVTNRSTSTEIRVSEEPVQATNNEPASSSNVSFPPSPEISIVENISVCRTTMTIADEDYPTINEMQNQLTALNPNNKFFMSEVDVSMPLMTQECSLQKQLMGVLNDFSDLERAGRLLTAPNSSAPKMSMTQSILNEMKSVCADKSLSDSLDRRLEQLLLESAQKSTAIQNREAMEVDTEVKKNPRPKKRSSTPNKKNTVQRRKLIPEVSVVEEECQARCGHSGRRSCPPSINIVYREGEVPDNLKINIHEHTTLDAFPVKRKSSKKDIIKVKISRPKKKPEPKSKIRTSAVEYDNDESGVFIQGIEDVSDLIHNHSELCLFNADCTKDKKRDSVEFIETTSSSIITVNSSMSPDGSKENINVNIIIKDGVVTPELLNDNAQCAGDYLEAQVTEVGSPESGNTQYYTPLSPNSSVFTEDLSEEDPPAVAPKPRLGNWRLLSEEDTNSNYFDPCQETSDIRSFGANLKQIFPIACAVPDLSTITEMSEKNSPKPMLEFRGDECDSQSIN